MNSSNELIHKMIVKVCGITDSEQYLELISLGVEMIGFNFYPKSKRYLSSPFEGNYTQSSTQNVGVFVNPSLSQVKALAASFKLDLIQLHGNESATFVSEVSQSFRVIKVFGVDDSFEFDVTRAFEKSSEYFLFDTKTPLYGGSGIKFNWDKLNDYHGSTPFLLSGGIEPSDITELSNFSHPKFMGVDINSGFEISPGTKDIEKIRKLLKTIEHNEESKR